jgi:hypothetical protein
VSRRGFLAYRFVFVTDRGSRQESAGPAVVVIVGAVVLIVNLTRSSDSADRVTVKIGTTEASADYWPILIKLAAAQGIDIQTVNFCDYVNDHRPADVDALPDRVQSGDFTPPGDVVERGRPGGEGIARASRWVSDTHYRPPLNRSISQG